MNLAYYCIEGERTPSWFVDNIEKYHRTFSTIINMLIEPISDNELLEKYPQFKDPLHKPDFLLVKARKAF